MMNEFLLLHGVNTMPAICFKIITGLCAAFMGIVFCQSAFDKIANYKSNLEYFSSQFAKTSLVKSVGLLLPLITLMETASGLLCLGGIVLRIFHISTSTVGFGLLLSGMTLLCLLFGQRIARDYAGAASLTGYFIVTIFGLMAFGYTA
jgi:hypothetical protein